MALWLLPLPGAQTEFYAPTSFFNHNNQHRNLCSAHKFQCWIFIFPARYRSPTSKFSGQVLRLHQKQCFLGYCSFL